MFSKILKYLIRQLKKTFSKAYVISLIIALLLWALIKFSATYQERISFRVRLTHLPNNYVLLSNSSHQVNCFVKTTGFRILLLKYWESEIVNIDFNDLTSFSESEYGFNFEETGHDSYPRWMQNAKGIEYENPEIKFQVEELVSKRVKVIPQINLKFKQGYILEEIKLKEDSITFLIPKSLSKVNQVYTYEKNVDELSSTIQIDLQIDLPKSWKPLDGLQKIEGWVFVDQLTEGVFNLPIRKEDGLDIKYFPSRVEVKYSIPSKQFNTINGADIVVGVESVSNESLENKALKVEVISKPDNAQILSIIPDEVEFLIFDND